MSNVTVRTRAGKSKGKGGLSLNVDQGRRGVKLFVQSDWRSHGSGMLGYQISWVKHESKRIERGRAGSQEG